MKMVYQHKMTVPETLQAVHTVVQKILGVPPHSFFDQGKSWPAVRSRFMAWYMLYNRCGFTATHIGELYGKDHTTVLNGINRASRIFTRVQIDACQHAELSTYPHP